MQDVGGVIFGLAGLLAAIALLPLLARRIALPFIVLLAALGCALGAAVGVIGVYEAILPEGPVRDLFHQLRGMHLSSEVLLWIFLPILLFETSLSLDGRALLDDLGPILTLAVVAVVVTMLFGGIAVWSISTVSLAGCLLAAAIVATTDPSAVISIFKEVGAPRRLVGLVEGESLLNDAAAIALFSALLTAVEMTPEQPPELPLLLVQFGWEFAGGAMLGAVFGRLAALLVGRIDEGGPAEITLSIALAYIVYALAETYLHVSGVVAVVLAGLVFGSIGRTRISARDWHAVHGLWAQLGFCASSVVFVLASTLAPRNLVEVQPWDLVLLVALLIAALAARALCLFGVLPLLGLGRRRWRVDPRFSTVILWGGLRGAVTLALALAVIENPLVPTDIRHLVSVLATGFVLFTIMVQATTLPTVIRWLGLDQLDPIERVLRQRARSLTDRQIQKRVSEAAIIYGIDLERAEEAGELHRRRLASEDHREELGEDMLREQLVVALATVTYRESELYVDELARGMIGRGTSAVVLRDVGRLLDALKESGVTGYRATARDQNRFRWLTRLTAWMHRRLGLERPLAERLALRAEMLIVRRHVLEDLILFTRTKVRDLFGERIAETAQRVLEQRLDDVDRATDAMRLQYPGWWQAVSGRYLSRVAVRLELDAYEKMAEDRLLSPQVLDDLTKELRSRLKAFEAIPRLDLGFDLDALIAKVPLLQDLGAEAQSAVRRLLRPRLALPGERIVRRGERGDAMFFIASGAVEVVLDDERPRLGTGDFFGEMALLTRRPRNNDVVALSYCQLLMLGGDAFTDFLREHPELEQRVRSVADARARSDDVREAA